MPKWNVRSASWFAGGVLFASVMMSGGVWAYLAYGKLPVAVADNAFPMEEQIVDVPLDARIEREKVGPPFEPNLTVYLAGASIYREQCAACHGTPTNDVASAKWMYPQAPQLWKKHDESEVVGVSDDEPGETFWKVKNGIRFTGMPAYVHLLTDQQIWDVSLLLKVSDKPLPDSVKTALSAK
jgi:thiosulfate dehydrogenase